MPTVNEKRLPLFCPSCESKLKVKKLVCAQCDTEVEGLYSMPPLASLNNEEQTFVMEFVKSGGSLKNMASFMGLSYPTVRNYLDDIISKLTKLERQKKIA
ncbi:MAG: DUF2089 family protein [Bacteroidota bacterium]